MCWQCYSVGFLSLITRKFFLIFAFEFLHFFKFCQRTLKILMIEYFSSGHIISDEFCLHHERFNNKPGYVHRRRKKNLIMLLYLNFWTKKHCNADELIAQNKVSISSNARKQCCSSFSRLPTLICEFPAGGAAKTAWFFSVLVAPTEPSSSVRSLHSPPPAPPPSLPAPDLPPNEVASRLSLGC